MTSVARLDTVHDENPLGPRIPFIAEVDGVRVAQGDLLARSWMGDETGRLVNVRWEPGHSEAGRRIVEAAIAASQPGDVLNTATNAQMHPDPAERNAVFESCGFTLWQEKEGFWWADEGQDLQAPQRITARPLADVDTRRFTEVLAACANGTLDRIDRDAVAAMTPGAWAQAFLDASQDSTWLLAEDAESRIVGLVSVGEFDPGVGTITYIAVLPEQRGRGFVDELLKLANLTARELGFGAMLSDTDVLNLPMQQAFRRNGHSSEATAWHKWMHQRTS